MEGFQRKINIMKHKINNIQANIDLIQAQTPKVINSYRKKNQISFNSPIKNQYNFDYKQGCSLLQYKNNVSLIKNKINSSGTVTVKKRQNRTIDQNELDCLRKNNFNSKNYEKIVNKIVDITNKVYPNCCITPSTIAEKYKSLLKEKKLKNEMISKLISLYNQDNKIKISTQDNKYLVTLYKWIYTKSNSSNEKCKNKYEEYCESLMREYNIKNIPELTLFFEKLLKKTNQNENFIEGIAKILLKDAKIS